MKYVEKKPVGVLAFDESDWERLVESRRGVQRFSVARSHDLVSGLKLPAPCLIFGSEDNKERAFFGVIRSRSAVTTLESRLMITRVAAVAPHQKKPLLERIGEQRGSSDLRKRLERKSPVTILPPKSSSLLIERLSDIEQNRPHMRSIAEWLLAGQRFKGTNSLQVDAIRLALSVIGLGLSDSPREIDVRRDTGLADFSIIEDSAIEHDARFVTGYELAGGDLSGRAVFVNGNERLEVFTANRRPLEECFGVDLIYFNASRQNIVMVQYKMLEPAEDSQGEVVDWIYRPDSQLETEVARMKKYSVNHPPGPYEYRLNPAVFYLKFVRRDSLVASGGLITPLDHFEILRADPASRGPRKGLRISFKSLGGRYLRQTGFVDLIRSGYIGAHADTTKHLKVLVDAVLRNNRALVTAIQQSRTQQS